jgi:hypothetical protein
MSDVLAFEWVAASVVVPLVVGLAVAWPLWRRPSRDPVGSIAGAGVALAFAVGFVGREYIHVQSVTEQCIKLETVCHYTPEPYTRFFLYVAIAMAQTALLFLIGARMEDVQRESDVAPEWRR